MTDSQREELLKAGISLAPGAANQAYMEQYYLYLAMSKPDEKLYLTYASMDSSGESKAPSYLIGRIEKLFPGLKKTSICKRHQFIPSARQENGLLKNFRNSARKAGSGDGRII